MFGKNPLPGIKSKPFKVECLSDNVPTLTATANDLPDGFDHIFSLPLMAEGTPNDLFIIITGSGNSRNILKGLETAKEMNIPTIGFL